MRLFRIVFCSLLTVGSAQAGVDPETLKALSALSADQIKAVLAAAGSTGDVHVGGTNAQAPISVGVPVVSKPEAPAAPQPAISVVNPDPAISVAPPASAAVQSPVPAEPPVQPAAPPVSSSLTPTESELAADTNVLTPVELPDRLEDQELPEDIENAPSEAGVDPAEDTPLDRAISPKILLSTAPPAPAATTTNATTTTAAPLPPATEAPAEAAPEAGRDALSALASQMNLTPEQIQAIIAAGKPQAASTELLTGQVSAAQDALATPAEPAAPVEPEPAVSPVEPEIPVEPVAPVEPLAPAEPAVAVETAPLEVSVAAVDPGTSFGSRADEGEIATDAATAPVVTGESTQVSDTVAVQTSSETTVDTSAAVQPELTSVTAEEPAVATEAQTETTSTEVTEEDSDYLEYGEDAEDGLQPWDYTSNEYEDDDEYDDEYDEYDEEYEEDDYEDEYEAGYGDEYKMDEAEYGDPNGLDALLDTDFAAEAQETDSGIFDSIDRFYTSDEEIRQLDEIENEFQDQIDGEKANWNFAFYLIVFVLVVSGVYYLVNLCRTKFFPKNAQAYSLLPGQDADIKTAVSSEGDKEEWNNDDW